MQNLKTDNNTIYDNVIYSFPADWPSENFENALVGDLPRYKKYKRKDILLNGKIPVIDQGVEPVAGYINDETGKYSGNLPLIIFGDHTRNIKYIDFDFAVGADGTKLLKPKEELIEKFFYYYLKSIFIPPSGYSRHYKFLKEIQVPIPDKRTQEMIVNQLDSLLPKVKLQVNHIAKARSYLVKFRQAIITSAISGKLTEDWRESNGLSKDDWENTTLGEVIDNFQNGLAKRISNEGADTIVLRLADINNFQVDTSSTRNIRLTEKEKNKYSLFEKDILIIRVNGSPQIVGNFILIKQKNDWAYCDHFIRIKCKENIYPSFLEYFSNTSEVRNYVNQNMVSSAGQNTVNQEIIKNISINLPSYREQVEIAKKIEFYFNIAEKVEAYIENAEKNASKLAQAVLHKFFNSAD